ncbi:Nucleoporin Nup107 [Zalerion maritima]|uniref:Nuclear pore complex protein n=1 Tax=Zalerion maritima TaxID=339359 RepID=A0AAD5RXI0_9PEZI|nr:Nucleoporin Nup107 [Zalerion maritima]
MDSLSETRIQVGHEVEFFARHLDDALAPRSNHHDRRSRIFKLVGAYHAYANKRVGELKKEKKSGNRGEIPVTHEESTAHDSISPRDHSMDVDDAEDIALSRPEQDDPHLSQWELEAQTWDLLRRLLPLRYPNDASRPSTPRRKAQAQTRKEYWTEFLRSDPIAVERKAVVEWLQATADSGPDMDEMVKDLQKNSERGDIMAYGWIHTRSAIKKTKIIHAWPHVLDPDTRAVSDVHVNDSGTPLVTQLDPDSTTRQRRRLQQQDEYFERAIWLGCFELLRRSKSTAEISEWCRERTEAWRAVSMSALPLSGADDEVDDGSPFDPSSIVLWRRMSYALARQGGANDYERAVYGILSGDIPSVEKVCRGWDDMLFAHYNALLRTQFDNYLIQKCPAEFIASVCQTFPSFNALQFHGDAQTLSQSLADTLGPTSHHISRLSNPIKALQAAIVTGTLDKFMLRQGLVLASQANEAQESKIIQDYGLTDPTPDKSGFAGLSDHHALRIISHVRIITNALDRMASCGDTLAAPPILDTHQQVQQNVVVAYVIIMRISCLDHLIPLYCSKLDGPRVYEVLSRNLIHLTDQQQREIQLELMKKLGLEPAKFVKLQPQLLLADVCDQQSLEDCSACSGFKILDDGPPSLKYGRRLLLDFIGEDPDKVELPDEWLIRSMEWLLIVDGVWGATFSFGVRLYKYFLGHLKLAAARSLAERVPCSTIFSHKAGAPVPEDADPSWFEGFEAAYADADQLRDNAALTSQMLVVAKPYWELECLARMLDIIETVSALMEISRENPSVQRDFWTQVGNDVKSAKGFIKPLMNRWLLSDEEGNAAVEKLREVYIPETMMGYISILHFAGTSLSRDNLLECMDMAAAIADKEASDVAALFVRCGRMKELLEAFASCSKAIAVWNGEKRSHTGSSKKLKEMGWSRELWSVRQN